MPDGFTPTTYSIIALFLLIVGALVKVWPLVKAQLTAARTADDAIVGNQWKRFQDEIKRLVERVVTVEDKCAKLEESEERCREELADAKGRIAELEGYNIGSGSARQDAARIVAVDRLDKDAKK